MIKLLFGEDSFSIQKEVGKISSKKDAEIINADENINQLINDLLSSSFFSTSRIFLCFSLLGKLNEIEEKKLQTALEKKPNDTTIVFIEEKEPRGKFARFLKKAAHIKKFQNPSEKDIVSFINQEVQNMGSEISPLAAERLAGFVGPSYWQLAEEVKKLALYKRGDNITNGDEIQTSDIEKLVKSNFEANIFELMDAVSEKNTRKSIKLLNKFLESGENEIYIFSMIAKQFRNIAIAKFDQITNEERFSKEFGIHPYVARKSIHQARNFTKEEILSIYKKLIDIDLSLKSGIEPRQALQRIIVN